MTWQCKHCKKFNIFKKSNQMKLLSSNSMLETCQFCGGKTDISEKTNMGKVLNVLSLGNFANLKYVIPEKTIPDEFYLLSQNYGAKIIAWIEQGDNLGIKNTKHRDGVCHALVVDWLQCEIKGRRKDFLAPFLVIGQKVLTGGIIPGKYLKGQQKYQFEKDQLNLQARKMNEISKVLLKNEKDLKQKVLVVKQSNDLNQIISLHQEASDFQDEKSGLNLIINSLKSKNPDFGGFEIQIIDQVSGTAKDNKDIAKKLTDAPKYAMAKGPVIFFKIDLNGDHTIGLKYEEGTYYLLDPNTGLWAVKHSLELFFEKLFNKTYGSNYKGKKIIIMAIGPDIYKSI